MSLSLAENRTDAGIVESTAAIVVCPRKEVSKTAPLMKDDDSFAQSPVTDLIITGEYVHNAHIPTLSAVLTVRSIHRSEALALLPQLILAASDKVTEDDQRDDACPDDGSESEGSLQGDDDDLEGFDIDAVFAKM